MAELSPAAQAVLDAYNKLGLNSKQWHDGIGPQLKLATALRVVATQADCIGDRLCIPAHNILAIATELENHG
jgi:hypothetical protein